MITLTVSRKSYDEYNSENLIEDSADLFEENLKEISKKILQNIVIGQVSINSLRNKFDLLLNKSKGSSMCISYFRNYISVSPFQLASFEFLDTLSPSAWIVINTLEELWLLSDRIFQLNFYLLILRRFMSYILS